MTINEPRAITGEAGVAIVAVMIGSTLLLALGVSLALTTTLEVQIAGYQRDGIQTLHAADAALARAVAELARTDDWDAVLAGTVTSTFRDGGSGGRRLPDGSALDLGVETSRLRCDRDTPCGEATMDVPTANRPWGRNNPRWQIYASGSLSDLLPDAVLALRAYVVVWVADDPAENDAEPLRDGGVPAVADAANRDNPGRGAIWLRAHAYGPSGARRVVDAIVERDPRLPANRVRVRVWREIT